MKIHHFAKYENKIKINIKKLWKFQKLILSGVATTN